MLRSYGWREIVAPTGMAERVDIPVFTMTTRQTDFPCWGDESSMPLVRQLPQSFTAHLDDKWFLEECLAAAGQSAEVAPRTWHGSTVLELSRSVSTSEHGYFLKHRSGVKGQSVYFFRNLADVQERVSIMNADTRELFILQEAVPPMLVNGRKFVLRAHAILEKPAAGLSMRGFVHKNVIVLEHAATYSIANTQKAVHVSSACKLSKAPKPYLLRDMQQARNRIETLEAEIRKVLHLTLKAAVARALPEQASKVQGRSVLYSLLGCDLMISQDGHIVLLEVNTYPALCNGTMANVDQFVYDELVHDLLTMMVLPVTDGTRPDMGGFVALDDLC